MVPSAVYNASCAGLSFHTGILVLEKQIEQGMLFTLEISQWVQSVHIFFIDISIGFICVYLGRSIDQQISKIIPYFRV
jgi:hypothetical protein